jgi:hypothetical protein
MAPPPPCAMEPCSTGTPRFPNVPGDPDAGPLDSGVRAADASADSAATTSVAIRGTVGEVRALPRIRAENTVAVAAWSVRSLIDNAMMPVLTDARGGFTLTAPRDDERIAPLRAVPPTPGQCAIGHFRSDGEDVSILSVTPARLAEAMAPTGITVDPSLAHVVIEVENALRARVRGVRVVFAGGPTPLVAYETDGALFGILQSSGPQGTAIVPNLDAPALPVKTQVVLSFEGRMRSIPIYVARGCVTFITALAP